MRPVAETATKIVLRHIARPLLGARVPLRVQRVAVAAIGAVLPAARVPVSRRRLNGVPAEVLGVRGPLTILYFHGGGYVFGSARGHRPLTTRLAEACGAQVIAIDYALAPERPLPAAHHDALAAFEAVAAEQATRIVLAGDSAGGGIALAAAMALRDAGGPQPSGLLLLSPWLDLSLSGDSVATHPARDPVLSPSGLERWSKLCRNGRPARDPAVSPIFGTFDGLPPILVQVGSEEVLLSDAERLAGAALQRFDGMFHVFQLFPWLPATRAAFAAAAAFTAGLAG